MQPVSSCQFLVADVDAVCQMFAFPSLGKKRFYFWPRRKKATTKNSSNLLTRRPVECFHLSQFFLPRNSNNNNINNNSDRLDMRLVRNSWLSWERHFTEFTIHRKKLARPFYKSKSEKTHLQTLHWSLSIGEVKLGLTRYKFVWESQIVFGGVCITISVFPVLMNMKCVFDNFYSPPSNGCQWRRFFPIFRRLWSS